MRTEYAVGTVCTECALSRKGGDAGSWGVETFSAVSSVVSLLYLLSLLSAE